MGLELEWDHRCVGCMFFILLFVLGLELVWVWVDDDDAAAAAAASLAYAGMK